MAGAAVFAALAMVFLLAINRPVGKMVTIKEFADLTGLSESTLRYYDQIGLIAPARRGDNRYRYYSPLQTIAVILIKTLLRVGVPLSTIKMLRNKTPQGMLTLLTQQEKKLNIQLHELQTAYSIIHAHRNVILNNIASHDHEIEVQTLDEERLVLGPVNDFTGVDTVYGPLLQFCNTAHENSINLHYPIGGYYEDIRIFTDTPSQPTRFFSLDPHGNSKISPGQYIGVRHKGVYDGIPRDMPQKLLDYAQEKGLAFCGPVYTTTHMLDAINMTDYTQCTSQTVVGVSKA